MPYVLLLLFMALAPADEIKTDEPLETPVQELDCPRYLKNTLKPQVLSTIDRKLAETQEKQKCLEAANRPSHCQKILTDLQTELLALAEHRQNQANIETSFIGGFEISTGLRNGLRKRITPLSKEEEKKHWNKHDQQLSKYLSTKWWPEKSKQFPLWKQCLKVDADDNLVLAKNKMSYGMSIDRAEDKHLMFPEFLPQKNCAFKDRECRLADKQCQELWSYWAPAPYGQDYARAFKRKDSEHDKELVKSLPPWTLNFKGSLASTDLPSNRVAIKNSLLDLIEQQKEFRKWVDQLEDTQLYALNDLTDSANKKCSSAERKGLASIFCDSHGVNVTRVRTIDECVLPMFGSASIYITLQKEFQNDQAFLASLQKKETWDKTYEENSKSLLGSAIYSPLLAMPAAVGVKSAVKGSARVGPLLISKATDNAEELVATAVKKITPLNTGTTKSYIVHLENGTKGVFKPCSDQRIAANCRSEVAAYLTDRLIGVHQVPETVLREVTINGKKELGSFQRYVDAPRSDALFRSTKAADIEYQKQRLLDYLIQNSDRHPGNFLVKNKQIVSIDHGIAFNDRYVALTRDLRGFIKSPEGATFKKQLEELTPANIDIAYGNTISAAEKSDLYNRIQALIGNELH